MKFPESLQILTNEPLVYPLDDLKFVIVFIYIVNLDWRENHNTVLSRTFLSWCFFELENGPFRGLNFDLKFRFS